MAISKLGGLFLNLAPMVNSHQQCLHLKNNWMMQLQLLPANKMKEWKSGHLLGLLDDMEGTKTTVCSMLTYAALHNSWDESWMRQDVGQRLGL